MTDVSNGFRRVAQIGNVGHRLTWKVRRDALGGDSLHWTVQAVDQAFAGSAFAPVISGLLAVGDRPRAECATLSLRGPNPFRSEARIAYTLPRGARVRLTVHDAAGRRVRSLDSGEREAGTHTARWAGDDDRSRAVAPELYFVRLGVGEAAVSLRILKLE
jgi:hypothetical protein